MARSRSRDTGWLDVMQLGNDSHLLGDRGRLSSIIKELKDPAQQMPAILLFLGSKTKDKALKILFPANNIRRTRSDALISLRIAVGTEDSPKPVLFADGDPFKELSHLRHRDDFEVSHRFAWSVPQGETYLSFLYSRLLLPFCDVICVFGDDFSSSLHISNYLAFISQTARIASTFPDDVKPTVLVIFASGCYQQSELEKHIFVQYEAFTDVFSEVKIIVLQNPTSSQTLSATLFRPLQSLLQHHIENSHKLRLSCRACFSALQFEALFAAAREHVASTVEAPFNHIIAMRNSHTVCAGLRDNWFEYFRLGVGIGIQVEDMLPSLASAMIADHYTPRMHLSDPESVFGNLYYTPLLLALEQIRNEGLVSDLAPETLCEFTKSKATAFFLTLESGEASSLELHRQQIATQTNIFSTLKSNRICLLCLAGRRPQHRLSCGHSWCDICVRRYGEAASNIEYQFTVLQCYHCLSQVPLVVNLVPPTKNINILAIDGGGVRGVVSVEILLCLQEKLGICPIQELVHLIIGTSSGGLIAECLKTRRWDLATCSQLFRRFARRAFKQRRGFPWLVPFRWVTWWLNDGCYDPAAAEACLKETYSQSDRTFDAVALAHGLVSKCKVGVIATDISKKASTYVFGNFNSYCHEDGPHGFEIVRPDLDKDEPFLWEAARATAAPPFIFPVAYILNIGSFQDGGLKHNNPSGIAREISRCMWPSRGAPALLLSVGSGTEADLPQQESKALSSSAQILAAPHFRNIFKDGMGRRARDAWLSSLDGDEQWSTLTNQLSEEEKTHYLRLNVVLEGVLGGIDDVEKMDSCQAHVILDTRLPRLINDAFSRLMAAAFYFELTSLPKKEAGKYLCLGTIRCEPSIQLVLPPLQQLQGIEPMAFATDDMTLGQFHGNSDICNICGRFSKTVSFTVNRLDEPIAIYLKFKRYNRVKISGFRNPISFFISCQHLDAVFGTAYHDRPGTRPCGSCDFREAQLKRQFVYPKGKDERKRKAEEELRGEIKRARR
ncbi:hypothetical protein LOZ65_006732 [Ophidiomyces ophidiicola]|nr:hypothetical protein LOZ65_006732 [Ophidiomyces ophidiicola]